MKTTLPEQKQAEKLLQRNKIQLHDIKSFSFMERYHQAPRKDSRVSKDKYGAGIWCQTEYHLTIIDRERERQK